ncbi:MAG TPA: IclR family transcriptional regulator [Azospirillum sp.]|nr:IclR family transcriptional regulator [Azospirillum sp.]
MDTNGNVKTAGRTLDVFETFEAVGRPLTLSELARSLEIPVSSCHALVRTLKGRGYLYAVGERGIYPTRRILGLARAIAARDPVLERLAPHLKALRDATGETVLLGKRQDDAVVYLEVVEGTQTIRYTARPGDLKPLHSSAIGKAMLGQCSEAELTRLLSSLPLSRVTPATMTDAVSLAAEIRAGDAAGLYVTRGENVPDVMALAASVRVNDEPYGIAVAGPLVRVQTAHDSIAAELRTAIDRIREGEGVHDRRSPAGSAP